MTGIPPWLNIDPTAPVTKFLQGYGEGRSAGTSARAGELADNELQVRQEQAAQMMAFRQQQEARQAEQFQQALEIRYQAAERAAQEASIRMEGQRGFDAEFQQLVSQGLSPTMAMSQTLPKWATKMFWNHPQAIGPALKSVTPPEAPQPGWTPSGLEYVYDAHGTHFAPAGLQQGNFNPVMEQINDAEGNPVEGLTGVRVSPRHTQIITKPPVEGALSAVQKSRLSDLRAAEKALETRASRMSRRDAGLAETLAEIEKIKNERNDIYLGKWNPQTALKLPGNDEEIGADTGGQNLGGKRKATKADRVEALTLSHQYPAKADAIRKRFQEVFGEDL